MQILVVLRSIDVTSSPDSLHFNRKCVYFEGELTFVRVVNALSFLFLPGKDLLKYYLSRQEKKSSPIRHHKEKRSTTLITYSLSQVMILTRESHRHKPFL